MTVPLISQYLPGGCRRAVGADQPAGAGPSAPGGSGLPPVVRRAGDRVPVAVLLAVLAVRLVVPGGWGSLGWAPLLVGGLVGLPHGAVDHLVPAWAAARRAAPGARPVLPIRRRAGHLAAYICAAVVMLLVLRALPGLGLLVFLALSLVHFGTGETAYQRLRRHSGCPAAAAAPARRLRHGVQILAWGGTTVLLPLTVWPGWTGPVLDALAPGAGDVLTPPLRLLLTTVVLLAAALTVAGLLHSGRTRAAAELLLLVAVFLLVPPPVSFPLYFGAWHSTRHMLRLLATDPANTGSLAAGRLRPAAGRFARQAAAPTAAALAALAVVARCGQGDQRLLLAGVSVLAALTVPHMLTVAWLDRHPVGRQAAPGPGRP